MTSRKTRHRQHGNPFNVRGDIDVPDWDKDFGRSAPLALDIGFAGGAFPLSLARMHPDWNIIGVEIREHFVQGLNEQAKEHSLHVRSVLANVNTHLEALVPNGTLVFVSLNFPDPWYKKRHHKRRVVQTAWLDLLHKKMRPHGEFHVMTDFEPQALEISELLQAHEGFSLGTDAPMAKKSTTGLHSERELTHVKRGDSIFRMMFKRSD